MILEIIISSLVSSIVAIKIYEARVNSKEKKREKEYFDRISALAPESQSMSAVKNPPPKKEQSSTGDQKPIGSQGPQGPQQTYPNDPYTNGSRGSTGYVWGKAGTSGSPGVSGNYGTSGSPGKAKQKKKPAKSTWAAR